MNVTIQQAARATAARLAPEHGPRLVADVEAALHSPDGAPGRGQYLDPISLGSLIVSVAALGWTVYQDHKNKHHQAPPTHVITRVVRLELDETGTVQHLTVEQRDQIIQSTVEETVQAIEEQPPLTDN
ncbi:hypothetical protein GCM10027589_08880 [Actinocorallia lasiicapitis]